MREKELIELLKKNKMHICCAESCTGGMLNSKLVSVSGASDVLDMGLVTYANSAKVKLLGVDERDIEKYGVVSEQVAGQMSQGAARISDAAVGIGISGVAGPGAQGRKPEGMVCFGFCINGKVFSNTEQFGALGRQSVREHACEYAINRAIELINQNGGNE